jgi:hypothetical protein
MDSNGQSRNCLAEQVIESTYSRSLKPKVGRSTVHGIIEVA